MSRRASRLAISCLGLLLSAVSARAAIVANSANDICAPADDPCIIDDVYTVEAPGGQLDFGLRTVRIVTGGRLNGSATITCGAFETQVANTVTIASPSTGSSEGGFFDVRARRACSGDSTTPCFRDEDCAALVLGTCSIGQGTIHFGGGCQADGSSAGSFSLVASGDVTMDGSVSVNGATSSDDGGDVELRSYSGSVTVEGPINANAGPANNYYFEPGSAGEIRIDAGFDVVMADKIFASGGELACELEVTAGRDIFVRDSIQCDGGSLGGASGGEMSFEAVRDLFFEGGGPNGTEQTRLSATGGSAMGYYYVYPGGGGRAHFVGQSISVAPDVVLEAHTSHGKTECPDAYAGYFDFDPEGDGGTLQFDGKLLARGQSGCGVGGTVYVNTYGASASFGPESVVDLAGKGGGSVYFFGDGDVEFDGDLDLTGRPKSGTGSYTYYGRGGYADFEGDMDVSVGGTIHTGSDGDAGRLDFEVCRMRLESTGRLDTTSGTPSDYFEYGDNLIDVGESMYAAAGSRILADGAAGATNVIRYRTQQKPPVLLGTIDPPPQLIVSGGNGCPECGNDEIDAGESCDDGNTESGDGCRNDCQDEGCLAATPGWPTDSLCEDFDGCTIDSCDPTAHVCENLLSCEEGVACTVDSCVSAACEHVPDDSACDDGDACTDDICAPATGCVHVSLTGPSCEDGDFCTSASTCYGGDCSGGTPARLAGATRIDAKMPDGDVNDQLRIRGRIRSVDFTTLPTVSGFDLRVFDSEDQPVFDAHIDAAGFTDTSDGAGTSFRFRDKEGTVANGVRDLQIKLEPLKGIASIRVKMYGSEIPGALGQDAMSASFLFGDDPATDQCLTARRVPCVARGTKTSCRD